MKISARLWMCTKVAVQLLGVNFQIVRGLWKIGKLPRPCVSIFGGSRNFEREQYYHKLAAQAAELLIKNHISVLTGGGPGIMEAANCGAHATPHALYRTLKIVINGLPFDEKPNLCPGESVYVTDFFARKWLLIDYSIGFIVFPGGLGTLDELSDLMNLMQTGKLKRRTVVLIGVDYWSPYKKFFDRAEKQNFLETTTTLPIITDDIEYAVRLVATHCDECR
jgi:hypothetical protein